MASVFVDHSSLLYRCPGNYMILQFPWWAHPCRLEKVGTYSGWNLSPALLSLLHSAAGSSLTPLHKEVNQVPVLVPMSTFQTDNCGCVIRTFLQMTWLSAVLKVWGVCREKEGRFSGGPRCYQTFSSVISQNMACPSDCYVFIWLGEDPPTCFPVLPSAGLDGIDCTDGVKEHETVQIGVYYSLSQPPWAGMKTAGSIVMGTLVV